ncbi:SAM hydrolase/SAM-dependent halogenase family protein [Natranaeroarchaeum aerophilus]|uniref:SAM-dependent chlorinase/fluorinase n=1 Tax=Natranaeroarchaeum aerophilus TaxID=2917711 RepID=A0AAE3FPB3_9EURY|nr:SAM-dependent chlorinase/fluorinase [Natranaeroarchaeum aerophilus]MCL9812873.1 SAM-dependent chlorinase/fluorinase [Natranaeroarchaeum aerophilus]
MITLASDFGSPYPAAMKGVILQQSDARLVDVSHEFPRQDVRAAAFWLREILPYFPPAVHLVVVDPGVGTDRAAVVVEAGEHALVAPDNGVVLSAARALADDELTVYEIEDSDAESSTFHGRDVFAPAAAAVHERWQTDEPIGALDRVSRVDEHVDLRLPEPDIRDDELVGEVLVVDGFGNVITNVPGYAIEGFEQVEVNGQTVPVGDTFASVPVGQWLATVGSHGNVELDVNQGRGDEAFGLRAGDDVRIGL